MARLKDKIVLITGAAGAIGRAVVEAVTREGGRRSPPISRRRRHRPVLDVTSEADWRA